MMAIPATRWVKESNRHSSVLEIDAPQLSRPGSSRSLKSLTTARPQSSAGHKRHHSKHGLLGRFKGGPEDHAPFRKGADDESSKKSKFPAFHDDNIIDPELADFVSDDSSGDEQVSIFATMSTSDLQSAGFEHEKTNLSPFMNAGRKHRHRAGEKSISGMSFMGRAAGDETSGPPSLLNHRRTNRRRNMSNVSGSVHHLGSPRPKTAIHKGPSAGSSEMLVPAESSDQSGTKLTRSDSLQRKRISNTELNKSSLRHVDKLLHQLLQDSNIPNPEAWQKALVPILLQCTDDVSPDVFNGEDMDIRHYVKLKRIPGGKPGDTSYVSGVVFTKNLALKSMPRRIANPRVVLVTFPIEYQRHQQHFMSLQPVIEQEKEFLRVVVQRITNLRPQLLLVEKNVSGVALQYLSEANISVAYNVKHTVIEAVSRCAETEIITSLDRLAMPVRVGRCAGFEVKTYVNNNFVRRKKSYIFLSGCRPDLGCTIALRGASSELLAKVKYIMEFMVYVVYNLKLESSLLRDEAIEPPDEGETSMSSSCHVMNDSFRSLSSTGMPDVKPPVYVQQPSSESEPPSQPSAEGWMPAEHPTSDEQAKPQDRPHLVPMHESHEDTSPESQVPDDVPMPTFYSDMVAKYETKILSASPYVKFTQPYLLMKAREQERRLLYLRRLRDQDIVEEKDDPEKSERPRFQLIKPDMVEEIGQKAPRQIMDILHAVHDAEYDKALFNYQTQTRQWETYIQGNLDLFDPYSHQNIVVLYSEICTETKIPCTEPSLVAINFYDEQHVYTGMDPDCTLGQYIQDLAETKDRLCESSGCERKLIEHHRTYVHDQSRITVFVENAPPGTIRHLNSDGGITMWTYCKICKKDSDEVAMSEATYKYSFGKYLELLYWGRGLRMKPNVECAHDHHRDHVRYFGLNDARIRIHWDPIDLLEIVVPRARITWKVVNDLKLKNEIYTKLEERWRKFMSSVKARLDGIRIDSVLPEKAESCKAEVELLTKKAQDELPSMIRKLQGIYVNSKYYEVVPFNSLLRDMLELAGEWDQVFAKFEADYLGDKDMRQLTMMQLKKMFTDNESKESLASTEGTSAADSDDRPSQTFSEADEKSTQPTETTESSLEGSASYAKARNIKETIDEDEKVEIPAEGAIERIEPLNLEGSTAAITSTPCASSQQTGEAISLGSGSDATPPRPQVSPVGGNGRSPTDPAVTGQTLTEKVDQMRREQARQAGQPVEADMAADSADLKSGQPRASGTSTPPPLVRAISHPNSRTLPRAQPGIGKTLASKDAKAAQAESAAEAPADGTIKVDKRFSDRIGITALKQRGKGATSSIPRLVQKKKESKVSTLARHFEQLSREFEKERIRDRKKRAASLRQPRVMLPRTSTKAIVQVYDDVNEAFEEPALQGDTARGGQKVDVNTSTSSAAPKSEQSTEPQTPVDPISKSVDQQLGTDNEESTTVPASQTGSDDEVEGSDTEPTVSDEFLPDIKEIADATKEIPLELPKHQKTSLMKYLTNFWAERSASGWPPLEYPVNPTDHIFVDSDVIVREDEPSSVIALALNSDDYQTKLEHIRREAQEVMQREVESTGEAEHKSTRGFDGGELPFDESELEKSLLRVTGTHLKYQFKEGAAVMTCKIFYAEQFDALRRKCGVAERIVESLSRCLKWDSKGGKTKSVFLKTLDDRLVLKVREIIINLSTWRSANHFAVIVTGRNIGLFAIRAWIL
jgi:1-phosphatidylinositol-3-phosphate 5-kinase